MPVRVRPAVAADEDALDRIDRETWSPRVTPSRPSPPGRPFFDRPGKLDEVLVAELDGAVAGYVQLGPATPLESSRHVLLINGLAVDPQLQGGGVGRALVAAAADEARRRGARKLSLRVLGTNDRARALYERCGFVVEGVLEGEFHIEGRDVDDILMALRLGRVAP